ncbi:MAG: beta-eliminating lyase-related protein [Microbacteriaceae bacterium]
MTPPLAPLHDPGIRSFASDNYAAVHPEVLAAIGAANGGHLGSYGGDPYTQRLRELTVELFGAGATVWPVFNGTGANVVALQSMLPPWGSVITAATSHMHTDENAAPERVAGLKLLTVEAPDAKLTPELIDRQAWGRGDQHRAQPLAVSVTQSTELGTAYTAEELRAVVEHAHALGLLVHLDGSRLANAAAAAGVPLAALSSDLGVDAISLGGTKNGLLGAEAVVLLGEAGRAGMPFVRKMDMQLASKMRFLSAQLLALLEPSPAPLWQRNAAHANAMAQRLRAGLEAIDGVRITLPTDANAVFAALPAGAAERARERFAFYDWPGGDGEVRLMCSWDTEPGDVDELVALVAQPASSAKVPE